MATSHLLWKETFSCPQGNFSSKVPIFSVSVYYFLKIQVTCRRHWYFPLCEKYVTKQQILFLIQLNIYKHFIFVDFFVIFLKIPFPFRSHHLRVGRLLRLDCTPSTIFQVLNNISQAESFFPYPLLTVDEWWNLKWFIGRQSSCCIGRMTFGLANEHVYLLVSDHWVQDLYVTKQIYLWDM